MKHREELVKRRHSFDGRSVPLRWTDCVRLDPAIAASLMRGTWQDMIPVNGAKVGEVARATMPQEDFQFDKITKEDLNEIWGETPRSRIDDAIRKWKEAEPCPSTT